MSVMATLDLLRRHYALKELEVERLRLQRFFSVFIFAESFRAPATHYSSLVHTVDTRNHTGTSVFPVALPKMAPLPVFFSLFGIGPYSRHRRHTALCPQSGRFHPPSLSSSTRTSKFQSSGHGNKQTHTHQCAHAASCRGAIVVYCVASSHVWLCTMQRGNLSAV